MTREEKIQKRKARALARKRKRKHKDNEYANIASIHGKDTKSWGRKKLQHRVFTCEMGYASCEESGICDGDC